jgi:GH24 family phage-related lysozyme (muramidase)
MSAKSKAIAAALATAIAIPAEGIRQIAYYDPPGILTVCYGSTTNVVKGKIYSLDECRARLNADMAKAVIEVDACVPGLPANVLGAFSDAAYNLGSRIACDPSTSTAARKLRAGDIAGACNELPKWDKARVAGLMIALPGLTKRRAMERDLCLQEVAP